MFLVDKAVMYESNALNKKLTCQMSPLVISLPLTGFWRRFSLSAWHCEAQYVWLHGLPSRRFWGGCGPHQCPPAGSLLLAKLAPKHNQSSGKFSIHIV